ncbi:hypothetical protein TcWFU_008017 [Taenia crassiceps]|uniref:Uncharacterized protein n=1 Tax=Taenia crassiceps TaxID=6207 RepID=A0ABR4Q330_9CEST
MAQVVKALKEGRAVRTLEGTATGRQLGIVVLEPCRWPPSPPLRPGHVGISTSYSSIDARDCAWAQSVTAR